MNISKISVKRPVAVTMIVLIFVVIGLYSLSMLSMELMPKMELSTALVYTQYPNVGSEEVENLVTKTIESAVSSVPGTKGITSQTSEGSSMIMVEFSSNTNMDKAIQNIKDNIDLISSYLPEDANEPMVMKLDTSMMPAAMMSVSYDGMDLIQTKKFIENNVQNKLEAVEGVASVSVTGAQDRIIEVEVEPDKLFGYGITLNDLVSSITSQNLNLPSGTINNGEKKYTLRTVGKFTSTDEISTVPLVMQNGQIVYLKDISKIKDTYSEKSTISRLNGKDALAISITAESDANTVEVVDEIVKVLNSLKNQNPNFHYEMTMEQASYIKDSISSVASNAITGAILAIFILLLFLANFKNSLVIGVAIPVSIITTFIGMYFSGMTLNVVSLGGLALGVGMLVDNSVVVLENIFRRRNNLNEDAETSSVRGSSEVFGAVVASVITTCIVYVPILFIDNIMAIMFKQLAFTIIFSQAAALIVTYLLVPTLTSKITDNSPNRKLGFILKPFAKFMDKTYTVYEKVLRWTLSHRKSFIASILIIFSISLFVLSLIGMTLMNSTDEGTITVNVELPSGTTLENTNRKTSEIENLISKNENVDKIFASVGSGSMMSLGQSSANSSSITVVLKEKRNKTTNQVAQEIRNLFADVAGAEITVDVSSTMNMGTGNLEYEFSGTDNDELEEYVLKAEEILSDIEGVTETSTSISEKKPEMQIIIDSDKAARYGLSTVVIANTVNNVLKGTTAGNYTENGLEYDIKVKYPDNYTENINELKNLKIRTLTGQWITLSEVADILEKEGYTTLTRIDQKRTVSITAKLYDTDMSTVNKVFEEKMKIYGIPEGISYNTGGEYEIMIDAMLSLLIAIALGILLMYMVMAAQFENLKQPFIIMFTVPLALIGVIWAHIIAGMSLSVVSCIGILMLIGIIVNNAIILIDFINTAKKENPDADDNELIIQAGKTRLRPILMTSITSILGFMPMALALGTSGAEMMQPLAVSLVGGLTVGTALTLFVIPVIYSLFNEKKQ